MGERVMDMVTEKKIDVVTPWTVEAAGDKGIDYDKLIKDFGCSPIDDALLKRFEDVTGVVPHHFLRRGLFFSHRDLHDILNWHEQGKLFYLYTGRGPSSGALHVGHLVPFMFTKWLQDTFDVPLVIQLTDDEKFLFKDNLSLEETTKMGFENARDIIAMGFDPNKTLIFRDTDAIGNIYPVALSVMKKTTFNQVKGIFGFDGSTNIGQVMFPAIQAAPAFSSSFPSIFGKNVTNVPCLIPCAIDQDPYFRMSRDVAPKLNAHKAYLIHAKFIPALQGSTTKMSGSVENSSVYVTDSSAQIKKKINKYAFSGGQISVEEHRAKGANLSVDVSVSYLEYFLEDDSELNRIKKEYGSGEMLTGEVKAVLIKILQDLMQNLRESRSKVSDEDVRVFMDPNRDCFKKYHNKAKEAPKVVLNDSKKNQH